MPAGAITWACGAVSEGEENRRKTGKETYDAEEDDIDEEGQWMRRRITSFCLALVLLAGLFLTGPWP